ncbi:MAG: hypothetical protein V1708_00575 [Candidatus Micrarchaeota archaeon]
MSDVFASGFASEGTPAMALVLGIILVWAVSSGVLDELFMTSNIIFVFAAVLAASVISGSMG